MTLQSDVPMQKATTTSTTRENSSSQSATSSEDIAPSPKRQNKKGTALTNAFGNAIPIDTVTEGSGKTKEIRLEIDSPPEQPKSGYPSLKTLIQEMGFIRPA